jgi:glucokinase
MAIAEWKCGAARGLDNVVFVNMETGVGGAVIANGRMIRGSRHVAGEIGQCSLDWQGRKGEFGNPGALEKYLGAAEIAADARDAYAAAGITRSITECSVGALIAAGHQKDPVALAMWERMGRMLATALANSCWLLNPEALILAGSITRAGDLLFQPLRDQLFSSLSHPFKDHLMVLQATFGHEAGTIGASALALEEVHLTV